MNKVGFLIPRRNDRLTAHILEELPSPTVQFNTSSYDAFGRLVVTGADSLIYFFRESTQHSQLRGTIVAPTYTPSTRSWGARSTVYDDGANDVGNIGGGVIGTKIYLFFNRQDADPPTAYIDVGYIRSTNLAGTNWDARVTLEPSAWNRINANINELISTSVSGTYLKPYAGRPTATTGSSAFWKTTDSGDTWAVGPTIYTGDNYYGETSVAYIGNSKMIAFLRNDVDKNILQSISSDDGNTWSALLPTNLAISTAGNKVPHILYDSELDILIATYLDRTSPYRKAVAYANPREVFFNPRAWKGDRTIDSGFDFNGYAAMQKIASGRFMIVYSKEMSASDADIWGTDGR